MNDERLQVVLDADLKERLRVAAFNGKVKVSEYVRQAIVEKLDRREGVVDPAVSHYMSATLQSIQKIELDPEPLPELDIEGEQRYIPSIVPTLNKAREFRPVSKEESVGKKK